MLVIVVLPAEYGIDPLGTGEALGLTALSSAAEEIAPGAITADDAPHSVEDRVFVTDARQFTLPPDGSLEFKYELPARASMVYEWKASEAVEFDFHTEPAGLPVSASQSFERGESMEKYGSYTAPYDGIHGWYWRNNSASPVTVDLRAVGFFTGGRLFHADGSSEAVKVP